MFLAFLTMISLVRKIVAGPKNRTQWQGIQLDLTYITSRLIAMAYPASGFEKTYRNSIDDVSKYFKEKHSGKYLIINISMRKYDYEMFQGKVKDYFWPDHQAPPLTTIFFICQDMHHFLKQVPEGVISVHCNHGKGRTGTAIIAFMLYAKQFSSAEIALKFYNKKRFIVDTYGVDQPCQRRYLDYTEKLITLQKIPQKLKAYRLVRVNQVGLDIQDFYIQVSITRTCETKHTKWKFNETNKNNNIPLINDIFIEIYEKKWTGEKQHARINYNLFFLEYDAQLKAFSVKFKGSEIKVNSKPKNFSIQLIFLQFCQCHIKQPKGHCDCVTDRQRQEQQWLEMIQVIQKAKMINKKEAQSLVYGTESQILQKQEQMQEMNS